MNRILLSLLLIAALSSSCTEGEDYFTEKFVDTWLAVQYKWEDCIDDGIDNSFDSADICYCAGPGASHFQQMEISPNNILVIKILENSTLVNYEYSYVYNEPEQTIFISDDTNTYQSIVWTKAGLVVEGIKDGCPSTHRMRRQ